MKTIKKEDYENILKYMQIHIRVNGEMTDDIVMESLTQDGDFECWLEALKKTRLDDGSLLMHQFYVFKRGEHLTYEGVEYHIDNVVVSFYTDYPNPGGYPVVIVELYLQRV